MSPRARSGLVGKASQGSGLVGKASRRLAWMREQRRQARHPDTGIGRPVGRPVAGQDTRHVYDEVARVLHGGIIPLVPTPAGLSEGPLRIALIVPPFGFGSGGHAVVFQLAESLERMGHTVSYWVHDPFGERPAEETDAELRQAIIDGYAPVQGAAFHGFSQWQGADVVVATGWQTVYPAMTLENCRARAYIVNDHEPEFYATSVESYFAAQTYKLGLPCILGGGGWLEQTLKEQYGSEVVARFPYPVAPEFQPRPIARRDDMIVLYGRNTTPRRAVGLALIALEELWRRRPGIRVVLFGDWDMPATAFPYEHFGPIAAERLSWLYAEATIGIGFSMTHGSLVPHDMMACGLPVLDLEGFGTGVEHAESGLVELAPFDPFLIADALERLLDDPALRAERAEAARAYVAEHNWDASAALVEQGLRDVLRALEPAPSSGAAS